jgi:hypothetical protein
VGARQRLAKAGELAVKTVLKLSVPINHNQVVNIVLD